jgi:hypothetical protein
VPLRAKPYDGCPPATHLMLARPYSTSNPGTFDNTTAAAVIEYAPPGHIKARPLFRPSLPPINDTTFAANFSARLGAWPVRSTRPECLRVWTGPSSSPWGWARTRAR